MNLELKFVLKSKLKSRAKLSGQDPGVCWTRAVAHSRLLAPTSTCAVGELDGLSPEGVVDAHLSPEPPPLFPHPVVSGGPFTIGFRHQMTPLCPLPAPM